MSPKTATMFSLIALLSLTVTLSSAKGQGCESVPAVLKHYGLPGGLFPDNIRRFSCKAVPDSDALALSIRLRGRRCSVTREGEGVKFTLRYRRRISAIVSRRELTNIRGVRLNLMTPENARFPVSELRVFGFGNVLRFVRVYSSSGINSPLLPFSSFPSEPPSCDSKAALDCSYDDDDDVDEADEDIDHEAHEDNREQDVPESVYTKYGRGLRPLVA